MIQHLTFFRVGDFEKFVTERLLQVSAQEALTACVMMSERKTRANRRMPEKTQVLALSLRHMGLDINVLLTTEERLLLTQRLKEQGFMVSEGTSVLMER